MPTWQRNISTLQRQLAFISFSFSPYGLPEWAAIFFPAMAEQAFFVLKSCTECLSLWSGSSILNFASTYLQHWAAQQLSGSCTSLPLIPWLGATTMESFRIWSTIFARVRSHIHDTYIYIYTYVLSYILKSNHIMSHISKSYICIYIYICKYKNTWTHIYTSHISV